MDAAAISTRPLPAGGPSAAGFAGRKRWRLRETPLRGKLQHLGLPPLVAQVLENRGIGTSREAKLFLGGEPTKFCDPGLLPGFNDALHVLRDAVRDKRLTPAESGRFMRRYEEALEGYTYLTVND